MLTKDFYGKNSFVWWTGIVEDRYDPLKLGQVRVRIFGLHTDNENYIKTEDLPWAQVLHPTNSSHKNSTMVEGDWVFGFFQDGDYAQIPVIMGVFPGIQSIQSQTVYQKMTIKKGQENVPVSTQVDRQLGEPTTKRLARGVVQGSLIEQTNANRSHVCDVKSLVDWNTEHITGFFADVVRTVRSAIRTVLASLGLDPSGQFSKITQLVKSINAITTKILRTLEKITEGIKVVTRLVAQVRAMIDYILSLPEKVRRLLRDCLSRLYAQIAAGIGSIFSDPEGLGTQNSESFDELKSELSKLGTQSKQILNELVIIGTSPLVITESFINPSNVKDYTDAEKNFNGFITNVYIEGTNQNNNTAFNDERYQVP